VSKSPDASVYISGTQVLLTATPEAGWAFAGWSGDWDGMDNPAPLTMDSDKIVTATFTTEPPRHYMYLVLITKYYGH